MEDLGQQILAVLSPKSLADYFIYLIFILSIVASATIPEKNVQAPYLMYVVLLFCVIDLLRGNNGEGVPIPGFDNEGFATFMIHIAMFAFPLIAAGLIRREGRKGGLAVPMCLLAALFGGIYAVMSFLSPAALYGAI